jgi:hypothetical protein
MRETHKVNCVSLEDAEVGGREEIGICQGYVAA